MTGHIIICSYETPRPCRSSPVISHGCIVPEERLLRCCFGVNETVGETGGETGLYDELLMRTPDHVGPVD